jgi:hypothetical protein
MYYCANEIWALGSNPLSHDANKQRFLNIFCARLADTNGGK